MRGVCVKWLRETERKLKDEFEPRSWIEWLSFITSLHLQILTLLFSLVDRNMEMKWEGEDNIMNVNEKRWKFMVKLEQEKGARKEIEHEMCGQSPSSIQNLVLWYETSKLSIKKGIWDGDEERDGNERDQKDTFIGSFTKSEWLQCSLSILCLKDWLSQLFSAFPHLSSPSPLNPSPPLPDSSSSVVCIFVWCYISMMIVSVCA